MNWIHAPSPVRPFAPRSEAFRFSPREPPLVSLALFRLNSWEHILAGAVFALLVSSIPSYVVDMAFGGSPVGRPLNDPQVTRHLLALLAGGVALTMASQIRTAFVQPALWAMQGARDAHLRALALVGLFSACLCALLVSRTTNSVLSLLAAFSLVLLTFASAGALALHIDRNTGRTIAIAVSVVLVFRPQLINDAFTSYPRSACAVSLVLALALSTMVADRRFWQRRAASASFRSFGDAVRENSTRPTKLWRLKMTGPDGVSLLHLSCGLNFEHYGRRRTGIGGLYVMIGLVFCVWQLWLLRSRGQPWYGMNTAILFLFLMTVETRWNSMSAALASRTDRAIGIWFRGLYTSLLFSAVISSAIAIFFAAITIWGGAQSLPVQWLIPWVQAAVIALMAVVIWRPLMDWQSIVSRCFEHAPASRATYVMRPIILLWVVAVSPTACTACLCSIMASASAQSSSRIWLSWPAFKRSFCSYSAVASRARISPPHRPRSRSPR
jgi:hypothetical protein